ncbi:hypothetical protein [Pantoea eucrina]
MPILAFAAEHPALTIIYTLVVIYGFETVIKACRRDVKKKRRK